MWNIKDREGWRITLKFLAGTTLGNDERGRKQRVSDLGEKNGLGFRYMELRMS